LSETARLIADRLGEWHQTRPFGDVPARELAKLYGLAADLDPNQPVYRGHQAYFQSLAEEKPDLSEGGNLWKQADEAVKQAPQYLGGYLLRGHLLRLQARSQKKIPERIETLQKALADFTKATELWNKESPATEPPTADDLGLCYVSGAEATLELDRLVGAPYLRQQLREQTLEVLRKLDLPVRPITNTLVDLVVRGHIAEVTAGLSDANNKPQLYGKAAAGYLQALRAGPAHPSADLWRLYSGRAHVLWAEADARTAGDNFIQAARDLPESDKGPATLLAVETVFWRGRMQAAKRDLKYPRGSVLVAQSDIADYRKR